MDEWEVGAIEATRNPRDNAVDAFDWSPPTSGCVVAGSNALARLPALLSDLGIRHAILVTSLPPTVPPRRTPSTLRALALIHTGVGQLAEQRVVALGAFQAASVLAALPRVRMAAAHAIVHALSPLLGVPHGSRTGAVPHGDELFTAPAVREQHELIAATLSRGEPSPAAPLTQVTALLDCLGIPRGLERPESAARICPSSPTRSSRRRARRRTRGRSEAAGRAAAHSRPRLVWRPAGKLVAGQAGTPMPGGGTGLESAEGALFLAVRHGVDEDQPGNI